MKTKTVVMVALVITAIFCAIIMATDSMEATHWTQKVAGVIAVFLIILTMVKFSRNGNDCQVASK